MMFVTKGVAFIAGLFVILLLGTAAYFNEKFPSGVFLTAVVSICTAFFAIQTLNNGVKGKYFNKDLYELENPPGETGDKTSKGAE
jgi:hypothetical protein